MFNRKSYFNRLRFNVVFKSWGRTEKSYVVKGVELKRIDEQGKLDIVIKDSNIININTSEYIEGDIILEETKQGGIEVNFSKVGVITKIQNILNNIDVREGINSNIEREQEFVKELIKKINIKRDIIKKIDIEDINIERKDVLDGKLGGD